ncbi:methyl-accepting chemotaxis protein [Uliginosibacterium sp. H1]|uniref:methyl-accepting chemotaxis protein n=1 Tax=Uliginosibacterium sp. H1 TaxID=3114757 RepID=UPI002E18D386|nr:methyl-accepting chemotaxis protein [Uliginosibacterium sp. H1]
MKSSKSARSANLKGLLTLNINRRIWLLVGLAMLTFAAASSFALLGLKRVQAGVDELAKDAYARVSHVNALRDAYQNMQLTVFELAGNADTSKAAGITARVNALQEQVFKAVNDYDAQAVGDTDRALMTDAKTSLVPYLTKLEQVKTLSTMGEPAMALGVLNAQVLPLHLKLSAALDKVVSFNNEHANEVAQSAERAYRATVGSLISAVVVGMIVIAVVGFFLGRSITKPLSTMQRAITRTADDLDFTEQIPVKSQDEIGTTLTAYNRLMQRLRESFGEIQRGVASLDRSSSEIDATARNIAENSSAESDAAASMAAAVEQMTVSVSVIASRAQDAAQFTQTSEQTADRSAEVILSTVEGIQAISGSVEEASGRIAALQQSSSNISAVAQMIREIADQTNLLALNAAIEAARAGEQGRGFAVVADEVRKLAERTANSTQQIGSLIEAMQAGARQAVESMDRAVDEVKRGQANAVTAGDAIREIQQGSREVAAAVDEITVAIREQASTSTAIAQQVEHIARMSEQNSAAAQTSASSVQHMVQISQGIAGAVAKYKV